MHTHGNGRENTYACNHRGSRAYIKSQDGFVVKFVGVTGDNDTAKHARTPINSGRECAKMGKNVSLRATFY